MSPLKTPCIVKYYKGTCLKTLKYNTMCNYYFVHTEQKKKKKKYQSPKNLHYEIYPYKHNTFYCFFFLYITIILIIIIVNIVISLFYFFILL